VVGKQVEHGGAHILHCFGEPGSIQANPSYGGVAIHFDCCSSISFQLESGTIYVVLGTTFRISSPLVFVRLGTYRFWFYANEFHTNSLEQSANLLE